MRATAAFAEPIVAIILLAVLLLLCTSSASPHEQPLVPRSRRLLLQQCSGASSCSTRLDGLGRFSKTPKAVFESLKKMPTSKSNPSHN
uniref:Secreted protein n=1 Tax=Oryza brachyantha TaxID=4533 RepID=J3MSH8_ORYBR